MKQISEKQDDTEKILSKEIKITDEEMRRKYEKFLAITLFGFELVIINLIFLLLAYITISITIFSYIMFFLLIPLGIAIGAYGLYGIYLHKRKAEKYRKEIKITNEEMRKKYVKFLAITFFGFVSVIINVTVFILQLIAIFSLIPLGIALGAYGLYGIYLHKRKPEKYREMREKILERKISFGLRRKMDPRKISIGLSGFGGFLNIIIGLPTLFGMGLLAWGTSLSLRTFIGITFVPSGILALVGAFIEFKSLIIGSILCLLAGILTIVLPMIVNYDYFIRFFLLSLPSLLIIVVGGILGILEWYRPALSKISKISKLSKSKKIKIENSKKIIDYLKIDNSGITQLRLSSVLQLDHKTIKKCLNYLEWLGVIEKKKVLAEETLFFYKRVDEKYTNDEAI